MYFFSPRIFVPLRTQQRRRPHTHTRLGVGVEGRPSQHVTPKGGGGWGEGPQRRPSPPSSPPPRQAQSCSWPN
ncbi:hypothetical protein E2C01_039788 [Portunus trituberculatus]|uniref:Uncharacterized protein n=1 Tax=Portunus trituberculatus TaxID=210409 RepID=A0A5B7FLN0_PORTR|nr:hypothetical protein [Portunus trituberculatus]